MSRRLNKRKTSTLNAINCINIVCHGQNKQTDSSKYFFGVNNERSHLPSQYSTICNPTERLELQSPMTKIQSKTVFAPPFLNGVIRRPFLYEQHIMNQKLMCEKKNVKSCLLAYVVYCDMELNHNILVKQYCDDETMCNKVHDHHGYHCKPSNTTKPSTFD
jgi:hypothetical protein